MHIGLSESGGRVLQMIMITRYNNTQYLIRQTASILVKVKYSYQHSNGRFMFQKFWRRLGFESRYNRDEPEHKTKLEFFIYIITGPCTFDLISGTLTEQTTAERQRECHQTKCLMSTTIALHVHFNLCAFFCRPLQNNTVKWLRNAYFEECEPRKEIFRLLIWNSTLALHI